MTRYLSLAEFWYLAEHVTGIDAATLIRASRVDLADSALHAPQAGFGDADFYPDFHDKAAVLACRIAWNHPLPDGNKRAAWACLVLFIDLNNGSWNDESPDTLPRKWSVGSNPVPGTLQSGEALSIGLATWKPEELAASHRRRSALLNTRAPTRCAAARCTAS